MATGYPRGSRCAQSSSLRTPSAPVDEERIEMPRRRGLPNTARALLMIVSSTCFSSKVDARPPTISVGEVTVKSVGADIPTEQRLRFLLGREIDRLRLDTARRGEAYVLSAS